MATFFAVLTSLLVFICVSLLSERTYNPFFYLIIFLSLLFFLSHTFFSLNMLVFYAMFEFTLIPMFLLILLWGARQRKLHAMYMFLFYTVVGSIFLLGGLLLFHFLTGSFIITSITFIILTTNFFVFLV
jgi:NADH:ubiquinone oxidoreductase subunit 4 (subunit M)